jgi:hypothetical protein
MKVLHDKLKGSHLVLNYNVLRVFYEVIDRATS